MQLRVKNVRKLYGRREVVRDVSMEINGGEVVGLLGPNGAGKTTTFYGIVGLIPFSAGKIFLGAEELSRMRICERARAGIGYLPQEPSIFRHLTVKDNLEAIGEILPLTAEERRRRIGLLCEELGLINVLSQRAITLSGGERRRLEIARSLLSHPKFLLLDEPFSGVDPINVYEVQQIILRLRDQGIGILITDHNVRETLSIVNRAYLIYGGKVLAAGSRDFLLSDPLSRKFYLGENFTME
ncbi:MAG: LPS export ABC transporter ATP-binding protein [Puniceicoccales bacterium]|jgi:lipopolysaccharide export system ATP-binding protein|nr:LPS export ABC transporter ATP-binding protein [Puniceicoccales bacterium]